jgi:hypothetical protein
MNSFSERKSYKAALLTKVELSAKHGENSMTKREGGAARPAPLTAPTKPRGAQTESPNPNTPSSDFITPTPANTQSSSRGRRTQALAMISPLKKMDLGSAEGVALSAATVKQKQQPRSHPADKVAPGSSERKQETRQLQKTQRQVTGTIRVVVASDGEEYEEEVPSKADILQRIAAKKDQKQNQRKALVLH